MIEFATSGKSVPIDTSMRPIKSGEAPIAEAILIECLTALSLEKTKSAKPTIRTEIGTKIAIIASKIMLTSQAPQK